MQGLLLDARLLPSRSSLLAALAACAPSRYTTAQVAGLSGLAFRLQIDPEVSPASAVMFPWAQELPGMFSRLGLDCDLVYADRAEPQFDARVIRALAQSVDALRRGAPSLVWGVHLPEFGILRGYDPDRREFFVSGVLDGRGGSNALSYDRLGRSCDVPVLLVASPKRATSDSDADALRAALNNALDLGHGLSARTGRAQAGLSAYGVWCEALRSGRIDPSGHAYNAQLLAEMRSLVAPFLIDASTFSGEEAAEELRLAATAYQRAAAQLVELAADFPFPLPDGNCLTTVASDRHAEWLTQAAATERAGLEHIERALDLDRRTAMKRALRVERLGPGDAARLFRCIEDLPLGGLEDEAGELRKSISLATDGGLHGHVASLGRNVVGHIYVSELRKAGAAIEVSSGTYLYVYCLWVSHSRRGAGIGKALIAALVAEARAQGVDGIFAEATAQEIFLPHTAYESLGFSEVDRLEDDVRLMYLPVRSAAVHARLRCPEAIDPGRRGKLPVLISRGRPCPLLRRSWRNIETAAHRLIDRGLGLELGEAPVSGVEIGGRRLPLSYVPAEAAEIALADAAREWDAISRARRERT